MIDDEQAVRALGALAQAHRLRAFRALVVAGPQGLAAGALSEQLGLAPAAMSFHLKELLNAGLLTQTRDGRHLIYRAAFDQMHSLLTYLSDNCCEGRPCGPEEPAVACTASAAADAAGPAPGPAGCCG